MEQHHQFSHRRSSSCSVTNTVLVPSSYLRSTSYRNSNPSSDLSPYAQQMIYIGNYCYPSSSWSHDPSPRNNHARSSSAALALPQRAKGGGVSSFISSLLCAITLPSLIIPVAYHWLTANFIYSASSALSVITPPLGRRVTTGTLFGHRKGHVYLAIQDNPRSEPLLILDLPISTSAFLKEMSSGLVRIALECDKAASSWSSKAGKKRNKKLLGELEWTMYSNGRKCGMARSMEFSDFAMFVLRTVGGTSVGAGVIPMVSDGKGCDYGELMYMRARFERVAGNRDSEAFYMVNPDGNAGLPELSIFLLRL
ncbi:unnamed protein product [Rhodiola kirilowii]